MRTLSILSIGIVLALSSAAFAAPEMQPLKIAKECSQYSGEAPSFCTVTESNIAAIPKGTKIFYYGPVTSSPLFSSSNVVLAVGPVGYCVVYDTAQPPLGLCAFHAGSGALAGFQAIAKVTVDEKQVWHWEGGYLLGTAK